MRVPRALRGAAGLSVLLTLLPISAAWAHAVLASPKPRNNIAQKTGPCGGVPRGNNPTVLTSGSKLTVSYLEQVDHPGYYQIWFSPANDADFVLLVDQIPNPQGRQNGSKDIVLPDLECETCTLRLIQVMTEVADPDKRNYYSCADIALRRGNTPPPPGNGMPPPANDGGTGGGTADPTGDSGTPGGGDGNPPADDGAGNGLTPEQDVSAVSNAEDVRAGCAMAQGALSSSAWVLGALFLFQIRARSRIRSDRR